MNSHFILVLEMYPSVHPAVDPGFYYSYLPLSSIILPSTDRHRRHHFFVNNAAYCQRAKTQMVLQYHQLPQGGSHQVFRRFVNPCTYAIWARVMIWPVWVFVNRAAWAGWMLATLIAATVSRVEMSRKRLQFLISLERRRGWPVCWLTTIPQTRKKLLWSIRSVNFARQVQEVLRRVELRRFNAKPEVLHPRAFLSPV